MALIMRGYDIDKLNNRVIKAYNIAEKQQEIQEKINRTVQELINLQNELANVKRTTTVPMTRGMLRSLETTFPWTMLSITGNDDLLVTCEKQPLFFHGERSVSSATQVSDLVKNDEIFYSSGHRYSFEAILSSNGTMAMRQTGAEIASDGDIVATRSNGIGHPHSVVDRHGEFSSVCQGNNRFKGAYRIACEEGITAEKLLLVLRKLCIWFSTVNLADMYGTSPCGDVDLPGDLQWLNSRDCCRMSSKLLKIMQSEKELYDVFMDIMNECTNNGHNTCMDAVLHSIRQIYDSYTKSVTSRIAFKHYLYMYNFLWALFLHSWFGSNETQGCVTKDCLIYAIRNDIRITLRGGILDDIAWELGASEGKRILASPLALTHYAPEWGVSNSASEILKQTFNLDTGWLARRLDESVYD